MMTFPIYGKIKVMFQTTKQHLWNRRKKPSPNPNPPELLRSAAVFNTAFKRVKVTRTCREKW
jgi:hypothetical protein